ncbi:gamma conglutin 1 [Jatropha curcas]|nr:gamma conglutin 1 [Jatropha curcas]
MGALAQDLFSFQSITGSNCGPTVTVPQFLFGCATSNTLLRGLPSNVRGVAGLGHAPISLPTQIFSHFGIRQNFALCLSSTPAQSGAILFGEGLFNARQGPDVFRQMRYTPLSITRQGEYFVQVTQILVEQKAAPLDTSLLRRSQSGFGGTMISTTTPYTVLEHSIYQAFTRLFTSQLSVKQQVRPVAPFSVCYNSRNFSYPHPIGPAVPRIDLVFGNRNLVWSFFGANSMVQPCPGVICLAFVDGGSRPPASIVIGAHQLQEQIIQFDLARSMLGFSPSLSFSNTNCANFNSNFTRTP